jgi:hypothetical protein
MPTISPFGIDGNPLKNIQLYHLKNIQLYHCIEITTLSPPLTSMLEKKQAPVELLQYSLAVSDIQPTQNPPDRMDLLSLTVRSCPTSGEDIQKVLLLMV